MLVDPAAATVEFEVEATDLCCVNDAFPLT